MKLASVTKGTQTVELSARHITADDREVFESFVRATRTAFGWPEPPCERHADR